MNEWPAQRPGSPDTPGSPNGGRGTLVLCCHLVAALALVAPVVAAALLGDLTVLAVGAIAAMLLVRVLVVNVIPWLERDGE